MSSLNNYMLCLFAYVNYIILLPCVHDKTACNPFRLHQWLHADCKQDQISFSLFSHRSSETNQFDLRSYLAKQCSKFSFPSLYLPEHNSNKEEEKIQFTMWIHSCHDRGNLTLPITHWRCWAGQRMAGMVTSLWSAITKDFNLWLLRMGCWQNILLTNSSFQWASWQSLVELNTQFARTHLTSHRSNFSLSQTGRCGRMSA